MNNYEGTIKREKMLANLSAMIKPARIITNLSHEELAEKSGLSPELIAGVEDGLHRFHESHYLALAAVFDNIKYTEDSNIYKAVLRIFTPEGETFENDYTNDFILVRRWFDTFKEGCEEYGDYGSYENYADYDDYGTGEEIVNDDFLEDLAENYDIYADTSAIEDENFPALVSRLEPLLIQNDSKIFVPSIFVDELEEDIENSDDAEEKLDLSEALGFIKTKNESGLINIRECPEGADDFYNSEEMLADLFHSSEYGKTIIITQDHRLAKDLKLKHQNIIAAHISDTGDLIVWR